MICRRCGEKVIETDDGRKLHVTSSPACGESK
jgi:hypothetical protein